MELVIKDLDGAIRQGVYLKSNSDLSSGQVCTSDKFAEDETKTYQAIKNLRRRDIRITEEAVLKELEKLKNPAIA